MVEMVDRDVVDQVTADLMTVVVLLGWSIKEAVSRATKDPKTVGVNQLRALVVNRAKRDLMTVAVQRRRVVVISRAIEDPRMAGVQLPLLKMANPEVIDRMRRYVKGRSTVRSNGGRSRAWELSDERTSQDGNAPMAVTAGGRSMDGRAREDKSVGRFAITDSRSGRAEENQ
jgi:hypothetical protein